MNSKNGQPACCSLEMCDIWYIFGLSSNNFLHFSDNSITAISETAFETIGGVVFDSITYKHIAFFFEHE